MSGRRSKKNQKFGSSRRGNRGLRVNEENDNNEFDGQDEVHTTNPSDDTVLEAQFDHLPSLKTDHQTTALECPPHAESPIHKDLDVEAELPERKRKIGSTRKKAGGFKSGRNLEPCDEERTTKEFGEEQETQLNASTPEEEHTYPTQNEQRNAYSDLWQQTQRSGSGGELGVAQNIMVTVSQSKETDATHHQEISSYSQNSSLEAGSNIAMEQSTAQSNVVTIAKTDHKTLLASTLQKRKMGSTRRPLGGNRERNRENAEVQELLRNTTDDVRKAEVKSSEAEFSMLEEMMQTWDDVKRKDSPTNTSSHTEAAFVSNQPLSFERTEELDVSAETETNNQSVACSVVDPTEPPSDRFSNHETLFLNKELVCFKLGLETDKHAEDCNVCQNVTDSPPTRSEHFLEEVGAFSDTYQDVPDSRHNTSENCGSVKLVETKEEPCRSDPKIIISSSKQDTEIDKLVVNVEEPLSSLCPLDVATKDGNFEISTDVLTTEVSGISETLESDITHAEPTTVESTTEMTNPGPDGHRLEDEEKETLMESSTSGQEMKMEEEYTQSKRLEHKEENMNIQATDDFVEQEIQSDVQQGETRKGLEKHSANETNVSDSSLRSANCNLANISPVTERLHNVNMNLSSLFPEDSKLSCDVMVETVVCSQLNDLIINNEVSRAIVPEADNREIPVEIKEGNDIDVIKRSITCDVTVTEIVMDVENFTEQSVDPQTLATRENENVGTKTGPETDALEINDQDNVENNAKDDITMQILKDERENEEEEGDTKDQEQQPASQMQGRPSRADPDKESCDFIRDASVENAEESLLNVKSESAFDGEDKTCEKYKMIEESGGHGNMDASAVTILDVTEPLANIPDNDIRSDLQTEKHSSDINFEALMQDAVTESLLESSAVSEQTEISIIPKDSQGVHKKDRDSEELAEKDKGPEFPEQNNVIDQNIKQTMMVVKDDKHEMTETVRKSTQELCDDEADKAEGHAEITSEQQQRFSLNISQKQDGSPQDDSENMLESEAEEMFLRANTVQAAFERMIKTKDESKETEEDFKETEAAEHLTNVNIQDNANQSDLQIENPEQNLQESEHAKNDSTVTDSGLSLEDSGESHKELENINEIPEDSQKEEKQTKIKPVVHKRKMGSTRRPLRGNKGQRKDREQDDESETLNNEEKEQEREISGEKDTGPVEELDSTIIQSSCNAEKSTEERICHITESQTTTKCHAESQETVGDGESLPAGGDTEAHLEIQTDIQMFDSTIIEEGTEENICDNNVLMRHVVFVGDTVTVESNMTIESDLLQNNTSLDTHQEALKSSENVESVSAVTDSGLLLKDVVLVGSGETEAVSEKTEISITSENSQRDSSSTLNPLSHKRKMGSTRRPLRGNKGQRKDREQDDENETLISESLINEEKSTEERICDITESQTTTKCHAESQETAGDGESLPAGGDTEAHLEIQTDIQMFDSIIIEEGTEENICDNNVLMRHVVFVGDTFTVESNMTIESDFPQNNTSLDTHQEALKSSETAQNVSAVTDSGFPLKDVVLVGSGETTEMSIISDNSQRDSPAKLNPLAHKRKMGSTRRPLRGNKEKRKNAEEKEDGGSEGVAEEDTDLRSETQEQNNVIDDNIIKTVDVSDNEEHEMTETVRKSTQELCDDAVDKADWHAEITSEQQLISSSNICQTKDGSPEDDSENMLELEMGVREEKDEETENAVTNIEATKSEEIFTLEDINSEVTVTPQTQNQLFIQTTDEDVHDYIQTVKDVYEESGGDEMFLSTNTDASFDSRNETKDESKETDDYKEITNLIIQDNDSQFDLQTENTKQNKVLTEEQNTNTTPHINLEERQETEHAENVFVVTDSGLSFGDSGESHKELENINEIPEDSQKEEKQSKIKSLVHKRKMGSTRRPLRGKQRKDGECHAESQETAGDGESLPAGGDTEARLEIQTEIKTFDSTIIEEGTEENICDDDVLMRQAEFVGDTFTVESNMTIDSEFLQNNTSLDTNQEALKSSENVENVSTVIHSDLVLQDVATESLLESNTVPEKTEISIIPEDSRVEDSLSKLNAVVHKRKMGSTRRPLRGNKDKEDLREAKEEDMEPHSEIQEQNDVIDHDTMQKRMDVRHNEEKTSGTLRISVQELCEHLSENKEWHSDITLEQEQTSSSNISQTQTGPSQDDAYKNLPEIQESNTLVSSEALLMEENQIHVSEPVVTVGTPQIEDGEIQSVFSRSVQKRKMGSTRKTQRGQRMEKERELGEELDGETKNATTKEDTIKPQENFILEEVMSLTIAGTHAHQQPSSLPSNKEGHDIENNGSKLDNQTENPEQAEMQEQNDPNTNPLQNQDKSEIIISEKSHTESIQSNMTPTAQKRKMGSSRKTLRGNGRRTREVESKEIDGDSERTSEEHSTEFATIEREPDTKLDENTQFKETRSNESTSKIFFETEDGVKKVSTNIVGLSVVSEEIQFNEAPSEAFSTDLQSEMLVSADEMKVGEKYDGPPELENLNKSKSLEEVESEHQLQLDQSHQVMHSEKHPGSETVTPERRRKMGSTRKNLRGKREEKKREESESNQFAPEEDQDGETSIIREAERDQIIHDSLEQSDSSLLSEIERALRKTSPSSQNTDYQFIVNEPNLAKTPIETSHFNTPENSEPEQGSDKEKYVSLQVTESQNPSEISSPGRRRKMGSTRKNPRQQLQAKREDENKEDETEEKNKQEPKSLKKDLEAAEESKMHDSRDNEENKKYLDVPVTLTNSCQTEKSTNSVGQEGTSPSTKRKLGSRRTNVGKRDLGGLTPPESNEDLTEDTGARLVSLDQMIKASQHDGSPGKKQTADLKNVSDMEVVQFNVVMVGNSSVGKTSFVRSFHGGGFSPDYSSTIGVDTCVQNVVFHDRVVKLQIWDTAGQERFHSITTQVFHRADGLFLMYEITSSKSFISVRDWISQVQEKAPDDVIMMLLGNKNDCAGREVQVQEAEDLAREYKINFMECSAATGDNVSECMKSLAEMLVQRKRQKMEEPTALKREQPQKKSGCC